MWLLVTAGGGRVVMRERRAVVLVRDPGRLCIDSVVLRMHIFGIDAFSIVLGWQNFFLRVHFLGDQSINALGSTLRCKCAHPALLPFKVLYKTQ